MASANVLPPIQFKGRGSDASNREKDDAVSLGRRILDRSKQQLLARREPAGETSKDIDTSRHTVFHCACTSLLQHGFHESFTELFQLVEQQRQQHEKAGPAAILLSPLVEHSEEKLQFLKRQLSIAEQSKRESDLESSYLAQREMAIHFEQCGDKWLADHFHQRCLETGRLIKGDNRRKEGEAHFHVGLSFKSRGELDVAVQHMETFHQLARTHRWHTDAGDSMHRIACDHLQRIYTLMADKANNTEDMIKLLQKAQVTAKEGGNTYQEGLNYHKLGLAYEKLNDYDTALQCHKNYCDRSRYHRDEERVGDAYNALARCHEKKGDLENAVQCLELYVDVADKAGLVEPLAKACSAAGIMFTSLADYSKAVEYFQRSYKLCAELGNKEAMEEAHVHCGIAQAHHNMTVFSEVIGQHSDNNISQLMAWKMGRLLPVDEEEEEEEEEVDAEEVIETEQGGENDVQEHTT